MLNKDDFFNNEQLNILFTNQESTFIKSFDKIYNSLKSNLNKQNQKKDTILNFKKDISLNKDRYNLKSDNDILSFDNTLSLILDYINENIQSLNTLCEYYKYLYLMISDLLITIDSHLESDSFYETKANQIKLELNNYSNMISNINKKINSNNIDISNLLNENSNVVYISIFKENNDFSPFDNSKININDNNDEHTKNYSDISDSKLQDNDTLLISEKSGKAFLPYSLYELSMFIKEYPNEYSSMEDVINKEFILPLEYFKGHESIARFKETYALIKDREGKSFFEAVKYGLDVMFKHSINPCIIAACKSEKQLDDYIYCLNHNQLDNFKYFKIKYEINPI